MFQTEDYGNDHPLAEEVVFGLPNGVPGLPGKAEIKFHESGEIEDSVDTFDTAEGQAHTLARSKSSKELTATMYANDRVAVALMEAWFAAAKAGAPGYKLNVTASYLYTDGAVGRSLDVQRIFPHRRVDSGGGQQQAATIQWTFKYWKAEPIVV